MSDSVIVIGGGGHAKVVIDCIQSAGDAVRGILDDTLPAGERVLGVPVLGGTDLWKEFTEYPFLIAVGNNEIRRTLSKKISARWYTAIHPSATVSRYASVEEGSVILPRAVINAGARVGRHCIVNTAAIVEHDCLIGDFAHISPCAALAGSVIVGCATQIGIGASVKNGVSICEDCTVGAGAAVIKSITEKGVYAGVPARRIK